MGKRKFVLEGLSDHTKVIHTGNITPTTSYRDDGGIIVSRPTSGEDGRGLPFGPAKAR